LKLLGLCLLIAAGGGMGCMRVAALRGRAQTLSTVVRFVDWWMREVRYTVAPLEELLQRAEEDAAFHKLLNSSEKENNFTADDAHQFQAFVDGLGATDLEGQLSHGMFYAKVFEERTKEAEITATRRGRSELMLWTGGATVLALLLL